MTDAITSRVEKNPILEYLLLVLYSVFVAVILITTNTPILGVGFVLFLAPIIVFWQRVDMRSRLLIPIGIVAIAVTVIVQTFAYSQGLWTEYTPSDFLMFSFGPIESYIFACLLIVYFVVVYEYFFDNQTNHGRTIQKAIEVTALSVLLAVAFGYVFLSAEVIVQNGFAILVGFFALGLAAIASIRQELLHRDVIRKAMLFSFSMLPIGLVAEAVLLSNNIRIYTNINEYIHTFDFFGYALPLEEVFLILLLPMWIVIIYELCFDDGR